MVWDLRAERADRKQIARQRQQHARDAIGERDHRAPSQRIEQPAEQQRSEKIAGRKRQNVPADLVRGDAEEIGQHQREGEEDRVVEERLRCHQRQADQRTGAIRCEQRVRHLAKRGMIAHPELDPWPWLLRLVLRTPRHRPLDFVHDPRAPPPGLPWIISQRGLSGIHIRITNTTRPRAAPER